MGKRTDTDYAGRTELTLDDGQEAVIYDPTEAVEEHANQRKATKTIGGLQVDEGVELQQDAEGKTGANSSGRIVAVPKRGFEEIFGHLDFSVVLPVSASDPQEAMAHARRYLKRAGLDATDFLSFNLTTHYFLAPLGKRECGWSFSFESKPFNIAPTVER